MARKVGVVAAVLMALILGGCSIFEGQPPKKLQAHIYVTVRGDKTVVLDGTGSTGIIHEWWWDLDDGRGLIQGDPIMVVRYPPGVYVVRLCVRGQGTSVGVPEEPGTPPWLEGSGTGSGNANESWAYAVVDLASVNEPVPIIYVLQFGIPRGDNVYTGYVTFDGTRSIDRVGGGLAYRWEIDRLDSNGEFLERYAVSSEPTFEVWLYSDWPCGGGPWLYRVTLKVQDSLLQVREKTIYLWVW